VLDAIIEALGWEVHSKTKATARKCDVEYMKVLTEEGTKWKEKDNNAENRRVAGPGNTK